MKLRILLGFALLAVAASAGACTEDYGSSDTVAEQSSATSEEDAAERREARRERRARRLRRERQARRERRKQRQEAAGDFNGDGVPDVEEVQPTPDPEPKPEQTQKDDCHPSYSGCLDPNASDYDCEGGSGDGPEYTGPVQVKGDDPFDLDRDGDGEGCDS